MNAPPTAFTEADLEAWLARLKLARPAMPEITECLTAPELVSFTGRARKRGFTLRIALDDGKCVTVNIDPVAAQNLICELQAAGLICGWLDDTGITFPPE